MKIKIISVQSNFAGKTIAVQVNDSYLYELPMPDSNAFFTEKEFIELLTAKIRGLELENAKSKMIENTVGKEYKV